MTENIIFLLIGSGIGFLTSLITIWFQHKLGIRREREKWEREQTQGNLEDVHRFMETRNYRSLKYGVAGTIEFCRLSIETGVAQGTIFSVKKNTIVVGRSSELCDYAISDSEIAEAHFRLIVADKAYVLEDISEGLGTRVNDMLMVRPTVLEDNDLIQIGSTSLRFNMAR